MQRFDPFPHRAVRVSQLARTAKLMSVDEVVARWGRAFFLVHTSAPGVVGVSRTRASEDAPFEGIETADPTQPPQPPLTLGLEMIALPIVRRASSGNDLITVGRLDGSDVCISDTTVSKFHAFIKDDALGRLTLTDAASKNGTTVNGASLAARGAAALIGAGDMVTFGSVSTLVINADGLLALARELRSGAA